MQTETNYKLGEWLEGLQAAIEWEWCPIDTRERVPGNVGEVGAWLAEYAYSHERAGNDPDVLAAVLGALGRQGEGRFSPDRFLTVLESHRGRTENDFEVLARNYAQENYTGPDNPEDTDWAGFRSEADYERWFMTHGMTDGEICVEADTGGELHWFDTHKW